MDKNVEYESNLKELCKKFKERKAKNKQNHSNSNITQITKNTE